MKYEKREITFRVMYSDGDFPFYLIERNTNVHHTRLPPVESEDDKTFVVRDGDQENNERCITFYDIASVIHKDVTSKCTPLSGSADNCESTPYSPTRHEVT